MQTIVVKFKAPWKIPGFGRKRFPAGVVTDVPAKLKGLLPTHAEVLENYVAPKVEEQNHEAIIAARLAGRGTDEKTLAEAGLLGFEGKLKLKDDELKEANAAADEANAAADEAEARVADLEARLKAAEARIAGKHKATAKAKN